MGVLSQHRDIFNETLKDLGLELNCDSSSESIPSTATGSPCLSSVSSYSGGPCTPTSAMCASPMQPTCTHLPVWDASQRSPKLADATQRTPTGMFSPGLLRGPRPGDASQRMPPQSVAQRINGGLLRSFDASQRTPPQHVAQRINSRLSETGGGDASQRCPAWGAAAAAAAATRAAAASCA